MVFIAVAEAHTGMRFGMSAILKAVAAYNAPNSMINIR
jgi:hypothetical protein